MKLKEALIGLLKVKSLITLAVMAVFTILALKGGLDKAVVASIITAITTYYFTKKDVE